VKIETSDGCSWRASSRVDWVTIKTSSGRGDGMVVYVVAPNRTGRSRSTELQIAGRRFTVRQNP
jgi:hypothetical protein